MKTTGNFMKNTGVEVNSIPDSSQPRRVNRHGQKELQKEGEIGLLMFKEHGRNTI